MSNEEKAPLYLCKAPEGRRDVLVRLLRPADLPGFWLVEDAEKPGVELLVARQSLVLAKEAVKP